jgi:hypothetical protein
VQSRKIVLSVGLLTIIGIVGATALPTGTAEAAKKKKGQRLLQKSDLVGGGCWKPTGSSFNWAFYAFAADGTVHMSPGIAQPGVHTGEWRIQRGALIVIEERHDGAEETLVFSAAHRKGRHIYAIQGEYIVPILKQSKSKHCP